jgi:hypothetical protein
LTTAFAPIPDQKNSANIAFDRLSLGYSPAPDHAGNLQFISRLSQEANTLAHKMRAELPPGYPPELHQATLAIINAELNSIR